MQSKTTFHTCGMKPRACYASPKISSASANSPPPIRGRTRRPLTASTSIKIRGRSSKSTHRCRQVSSCTNIGSTKPPTTNEPRAVPPDFDSAPRASLSGILRSARSARLEGLLRADFLIGVVHDVDLVGVADAEGFLIVDDADVLTGVHFAHLIRRFAVRRKDLIELRNQHEAQDLLGARILHLDVLTRNVNGNAVKRRVRHGERARRQRREESCRGRR